MNNFQNAGLHICRVEKKTILKLFNEFVVRQGDEMFILSSRKDRGRVSHMNLVNELYELLDATWINKVLIDIEMA